jgi:hypothetical protein
MSVERTFGMIKGRFKRFRYPAKNGDKENHLNHFIFVCCIHNMILKFSEIEICGFYYDESIVNDI